MTGAAMERMCREVVRRIAEYMDGELPFFQTELIRLHLRMCERCGPRYRFEKALMEEIRRKTATLKAPAPFVDRVARLVDGRVVNSEPHP